MDQICLLDLPCIKKSREFLPGVLSTYELFVFFSHPDFTVGPGILIFDQSPDQPPYAGRGLYRR